MITLAAGSGVVSDLISNIEGIAGSLGPAVKYIFAIVVFIIGKSLIGGVTKLIEKGLKKTGIDEKIASSMGASAGSTEKVIASFIQAVLMLVLVITALDIAELTQIVQPLNRLLDSFLGAIPNILVAGIVFYLGLILAKIVKSIVSNVLNVARIDHRLGAEEGKTPIADGLSIAIYCFIILLFAPVALRFLNMPEISDPMAAISYNILDSVDNILMAAVLIAVGVLIGQIAKKLVTSLLEATGIDKLPEKAGLSIPSEGKNSISGIAGLIVFISILVLLISSAINVLGIELLSQASEVVLGGYFNVLLAVFIFGAGFIGGKFVYSQLADKNLLLAKVINGLIVFVTSIVALDRSGLAPDITGLPFTVIVISVGVAFGIGGAIAIGLGGKDYVARFLNKKG